MNGGVVYHSFNGRITPECTSNINRASFRYIPFNNGLSALVTMLNSSSWGRLAKTEAAIDILQVSAPGYKTKKSQWIAMKGQFDFILETEAVENCTKYKSCKYELIGEWTAQSVG